MAQVARDTPSAPDRPAEPASSAMSQVAGGASASADRRALSAGEIRVFIHYFDGSGGDAAQAQRLAEHLRRQGYTVVDMRPVDFSIGKPSVRYFFEDDRSASDRLVDELRRFLEGTGTRVPERASDFTDFTPKPRPGNVEVWLSTS
jgi:hypothetical protein